MAYENIDLSELMEMARTARNEQEQELPEDDILNLDEEEFPFVPKRPKINMEVCIRQTLQDLEVCHLSEEDQKTVEEFLTFQLQTSQLYCENRMVGRAFYNLMLVSQEQETAARMVQILRSALDIAAADVLVMTEKEAIERFEPKTRYSSAREYQIPEATRLLVITDCKEAPKLNTDGGGTARDKSAKEIEAYRNMWRRVCTHIATQHQTVLLVCCSPDAYRNSLRPNLPLSRRLCSHTIFLRESTPQELLQDCLDSFRSSGFTLAEGFEAALADYFPAACRVSDLKGQALVEDMVSRVFTRYYCQKREQKVLTPDCVPDDDPQLRSVEEVLGQLGQLVGLEKAKEEISNIYKMQVAGLAGSSVRYHMLFTGNPGTGKTTVARMTADLLFSMDLIKTNKLVVAKPCDMVSEWIGGTGTKAMEVIRRAYNGVLFIDEAYGIATMDRGEELLNILVQEMENNSDKLVVIFAGYTDEMRELMKANPGLASRIGREILFDDYSQEELADIFLLMCKEDGFSIHPDARDELDSCIAGLMTREFFGNARTMRNMLQDLKEVWSDDYYEAAQKYGQDNVELPREFTPRHFERIMPPKKEVSIRDLVGLEVMKSKLEAFKQQALYQKRLKEKGITGMGDFAMHMIFTGNPGTGKTTVAKLIADDLYAIGMLKTNRLVVAERKDLVSAYGDTAKKTADVVRKAVGGVLFIDEAYALADARRGSMGNECIEVLLTAMEEHKGDTVFIFAGYVEQMQEFIAMNPGIRSRIGYTFHFEDYSAQELTRMYREKMHKAGFVVSAGALNKVRRIMEYFQDVKHFGNGRFVDHVIHQTVSQRASRDFSTQYRNIRAQDIPDIKTLIETAPNGMMLYDPAKITPQERRRTALHELGHAIVMLHTDPKNVPESISIRNWAGSLGRVRQSEGPLNWTEGQLMDHIAMLLAGKNAERLILGDHDTGCASDYARAKRVAGDMVENYAMVTFGTTAVEILKEADRRSNQILEGYRQCLPELADHLVQEKELTGEALLRLLRKE